MARRRKRDPTPAFFLAAVLTVAGIVVVVQLGGLLGADPLDRPSRSMERERGLGEAEPPAEVPRERVRVEVLNAAGVPGLAARARDRLRDAGFDVVYYGNAAAFDRETSAVLDRVGRPSLAEEVARALGIADVTSQPDPELLLEASVFLGRDWPAASTESEEVELPLGEADGRWWDLRRIFRDSGR